MSSYEFKVERIKAFSAVSKSSHSIFSADIFEKGIAAIDFEDLVLESIYQARLFNKVRRKTEALDSLEKVSIFL